MAAAALSQPLLVIEESEARAVAKGIANVARHYDVGRLSAQTMDWVNLCMTLITVYGTRFAAMRMQASKAEAAASPATNVFGFPVGQGG